MEIPECEGSQGDWAGELGPHLATAGGQHCPAWPQGGGGPVQAFKISVSSEMISSATFSPKAECTAPGCKDPRASGHTCFVPSTAKPLSITSPSNMQMARTNLKCDLGNTKDSLSDQVQLTVVNSLLVVCGSGMTNLCENSAIFNHVVDHLFCQYRHEWRVSPQQSFKFTERQV